MIGDRLPVALPGMLAALKLHCIFGRSLHAGPGHAQEKRSQPKLPRQAQIRLKQEGHERKQRLHVASNINAAIGVGLAQGSLVSGQEDAAHCARMVDHDGTTRELARFGIETRSVPQPNGKIPGMKISQHFLEKRQTSFCHAIVHMQRR